MFEFIAIGGILFWILTAAAAAAMITGIAREEGWLATGSFIAYLLIIAIFSPFNMLGTILANPLWLLAMLGIYFVCGILWVFPRWEMFCRGRKKKYNELRDEWLAEKGHAGKKNVPDELKAQWTSYVMSHAEDICDKHCPRSVRTDTATSTQVQNILTPRVRTHKKAILFWMSYWPLDAFWTFANDIIIGVWDWIYTGIGSALQSRANKTFSGVVDDFKTDADG